MHGASDAPAVDFVLRREDKPRSSTPYADVAYGDVGRRQQVGILGDGEQSRRVLFDVSIGRAVLPSHRPRPPHLGPPAVDPTRCYPGHLHSVAINRPGIDPDLVLDFNESLAPPQVLREDWQAINRYPDKAPLERQIAGLLGLPPEGVLITCGADDALERTVRVVVGPDRKAVLTTPTYGMIRRFVLTAGGQPDEVEPHMMEGNKPWVEWVYHRLREQGRKVFIFADTSGGFGSKGYGIFV